MGNVLQDDIENILNNEIIPWQNLEGKSILVSGATGMLGSYIVETLAALNKGVLKNKCKIFALCRSEKKAKLKLLEDTLAQIELVIGDICDLTDFDEHIDYIIHTASPASSKAYGKDPIGTIDANVIGTKNLLKIADKSKSDCFVFISSGEVYGVTGDLRYIKESDYGYIDISDVRACYAESKRLAENMCVAWRKQHNLNAKIVRLFHTYGSTMDLNDGRVFSDFVNNIVNNKNIILHSDGSDVRALCYISDSVTAILLVLLKQTDSYVYNVGNPTQETTILDFANRLVNLFPEKNLEVIVDISQKSKEYISSPLSRHCPSIDKINQLGWSPVVDIETGFAKVIRNLE